VYAHIVVCITRLWSMTVLPPYGHKGVTIIPTMNSLLATIDTGYGIITQWFWEVVIKVVWESLVFLGKVNDNLTLGQLYSWGWPLVSTNICPEYLCNQTIEWGKVMVSFYNSWVLSLISRLPWILDCYQSLREVEKGWPNLGCYWEEQAQSVEHGKLGKWYRGG